MFHKYWSWSKMWKSGCLLQGVRREVCCVCCISLSENAGSEVFLVCSIVCCQRVCAMSESSKWSWTPVSKLSTMNYSTASYQSSYRYQYTLECTVLVWYQLMLLRCDAINCLNNSVDHYMVNVQNPLCVPQMHKRPHALHLENISLQVCP